jgi:hypothetical protein
VSFFFSIFKPFNLNDHSITSTAKGQTLELSHVVIKKLYKLLKITNPGFSYKGIRASSKTQMSDLFVSFKKLK